MLKATSVRLEEDTLQRIEKLAKAMDRPRAWVMAYAIREYVAREESLIAQIEEGVQAAEAGRLVDHDMVAAIRELDRLARHWHVSRAEALGRAIRATRGEKEPSPEQIVAALDRLQDSLALSEEHAGTWADAVEAERHESSKHRLSQ